MSSKVSRLQSKPSQTESLAPPLPGWKARVVDPWRENPERLAWLVILAGFAVFAFLAISIPLAIQYTIRYTTVSDKAKMERALGTLLLYQSTGSEAVAI